MKKKVLAFAAMACSVAMLLSACGGSNSNAASGDTAGSNIITAYNSEPQNPLIPGNTNETGGGKPGDLLFSRLVSFDKDGKASNEVAESITPNDDATQYTIKIKSGWNPPLRTPNPVAVTCHFCALGRQAVYFLLHPCKIPGFLPARFSLC